MKKVVLLLTMLILAGCGNDEVEVNGSKMEYEELLAEIEKSKADLEVIEKNKSTSQTELAEIEKNLDDKKDKYEALEKLAADQKNVESNLEKSKNEITSLQVEIDSAETELKGLQGAIVKVKDEPIRIGAGYYYFGDDIPPGRYKAVPQEGQSGNFFVRDINGSKVNTILGHRTDYGHVEEFLFEGFSGDEVEATLPVLLYPAE